VESGKKIIGAALVGAIVGGTAVYLKLGAQTPLAHATPILRHRLPPAKDGGTVVELCDGVTSTEVRGLKPGQPMSHEQAMEVSRGLMAQWQRKHPDQHWIMADSGAIASPSESQANRLPASPSASTTNGGEPAASPTAAASFQTQQGDTYASFHQRDFMIFQAETDNFVEEGKKIFHSAKLLGGTIGVSCDMCHPDAANTHPETYPKYQEQLQRVALLRDMINWCIENPVKGKTLDANDPRLRALEAYILAQRKGVPLAYGKH
jgi:thiosulfate dehydrogenase